MLSNITIIRLYSYLTKKRAENKKIKAPMRGIEPRFARRSVPERPEMKANRDSHYTTSDNLVL